MAVVILRSSASNATEIACGDVDASGLPPSRPGPSAPAMTPQPAATTAPAVTVVPTSTPMPAPTVTPDPNDPTCQDFDAWVWAQTVFDNDREAFAAALDPDGNGLACEELTIHGFAPALWTDEMPAGLIPVQATGFYSGDTLQILVNGQIDVVRLKGISSPAPQQCGYVSSGSFLAFALTFPENYIIQLDYQGSQRDEQNRIIADVWFDYAGDTYMLNEAMVRNGWAQANVAEGDPLAEEFEAAAAFGADHVLGLHLECGGIGVPVGSAPTAEQIEQARERQPNQGQFGA